MLKKIEEALAAYRRRTGRAFERPEVVMFDMDGILFDSMPLHCVAWKTVCDEYGLHACRDEFYATEGRTGASTIDMLCRRQFGRAATEEEVKEIYARKCELFKQLGEPPLIAGARDVVDAVLAGGSVCVLVTGSGQRSVLDRLDREYPGAFASEMRVTAFDVNRGKPDPEPYLIGIEKGGAQPWTAIGIDNAPLGVESSSKSGAFTIGVRTGPLEEGSLLASGADIEINSMTECAKIVSQLLLI